jgi:AraC-like DNA-binding protein
VAGPADRPGFVELVAGTVVTGVRLRVGWGGACLGLDAASLRNRVVVGREAVSLIGSAASAMLRARSLEELQGALVDTACAMSDRAIPSSRLERVLQAVELMRQGVPIGALGPQTGTTERTLRRDMDACVGLPLRTLAGILRFQRAMARLHSGAGGSLGELALEAGYSDQAHMTRAFRRFGLFTPALPEASPVVESVGQYGAWP